MTIEIFHSNNQDIDGLLWGWAWGDGGAESLRVLFPTSTDAYSGYEEIKGFSSFNPAQQTAVRNALANIASFCNLTFSGTATDGPTLRYAEATEINYTDDKKVGRETGLHKPGDPFDSAEANPPRAGLWQEPTIFSRVLTRGQLV